MPSNQYRSGDVLCPFYKGRSLLEISCEGLFDGVTLTRLIFPRKTIIDFHFINYCTKKYKYCELYRMILDKYPDENENAR